MLGTVARGTYVVVLATMIAAWVVSFNKEAPAETQPSQRHLVHIFLRIFFDAAPDQVARKSSTSSKNLSHAGSPASRT